MENSETFLGGFAGGFLARGLTHIGYGIYFTTSRLIGIDLGANGGGALGGTLAGFYPWRTHATALSRRERQDDRRSRTDERVRDRKGPD